jgi:hypothetical protein
MAEPALEHVQWNALNCGMDTESMPETYRAPVRRNRDARLDHLPFHDLPDPDAAQVPDRGGRLLAGLLGLPDRVSDVDSIEKFRRDRDRPERDLRTAGGILALLQGPDCDGPTGEVDARRCYLEELRGTAPSPMERLAQRPVPSELAPGHGEEGRTLLAVEVGV